MNIKSLFWLIRYYIDSVTHTLLKKMYGSDVTQRKRVQILKF